MLVQIITDNHIHSRDGLANEVEASIRAELDRYSTQITRVEAHLADENSKKGGGDDKKCTLEARVAGVQAMAATGNGGSVDQAVAAALDKLVAQLDHKLGKLSDRKGRPSMGGDQGGVQGDDLGD
jgi:ribosome-associated translation inhibitor RaiA